MTADRSAAAVEGSAFAAPFDPGDWHSTEADAAVTILQTDPRNGLGSQQAARRLERYGRNLLHVTGLTSWRVVLARQFSDWLILVLDVAALISLALGELADGGAILTIVVLNGLLGFAQEWQAEQALQALRDMLAPRCKVVRDGREQEQNAATLVPGDIVLLHVGDRVPADLRLLKALNLRVDESALTGEAGSVSKGIEPAEPRALLAERNSMAWMGTAVTNGHARGVVVATGMATEFGRIAHLTQTLGHQKTPLQRELARLGKQLGAFSIAVSLLVATTGWLLGRPLLEMFLTGVSLAVAAVPEGLPAVVTITLALGVRAMVRRRALLRQLQAAETLGAATVICTDKTGTLTQNEMTVKRIWLLSSEIHITGEGYAPGGRFQLREGEGERETDPFRRPDLMALLETGMRCNNARIYRDEKGWSKLGEATEAALLAAARKAGLQPEPSPDTAGEFSFTSARKRMTVISRDHPQSLTAHVKGAPEVILERSTRILDGAWERELTEADRQAALAAHQDMAADGLRTLALARRSLRQGVHLDEDQVETKLTLLGIVGILDPPRREVPEAIRLAGAAGIRVVMITGDAPATALAIARRIGLEAARAVSGTELASMDDARLRAALEQGVLFARTSPEHKLRIVTLLQGMGHVVAMTGDGVNDAPALKQADIGIAMGLRGTDVARSASDLVLTDDNFASIIAAVEEGRRQYDNIRRFVRYLLSSNFGEMVAIFLNIVLGGPLILLPAQILWINLVTDGVTAVALGVEPAEKTVLERPPRSLREPVLNPSSILLIAVMGLYMGLATLWLFQHYLSGRNNAAGLAQTAAFAGLVMLEMMNVFNFRTYRAPLGVHGFFTNPWLLLAWASSVGLLACAVYVPFLQTALHTTPLGWGDWGLILAVSAPLLIVPEMLKLRRSKLIRASG